ALNPALSLWLMGYPDEWLSCGARAMESARRLQRCSRGRTWRQFRLCRPSARGPHHECAHARDQIYSEDVTDVLTRVVLIGRLTADPELRYTQNGVAVTTFRIAVDRPFINQQGERETDFFPIVTWRKLAEVCVHNLNK